MKNDGRLGRHYLLAKEGDKMNAILCGAGHNMRKLLAAFLFSFLAGGFEGIYWQKTDIKDQEWNISRLKTDFFQGRLVNVINEAIA